MPSPKSRGPAVKIQMLVTTRRVLSTPSFWNPQTALNEDSVEVTHQWVTKYARRGFDKFGYTFVMVRIGGHWHAAETTTGHVVMQGCISRPGAMEAARACLDKIGKVVFDKRIVATRHKIAVAALEGIHEVG